MSAIMAAFSPTNNATYLSAFFTAIISTINATIDSTNNATDSPAFKEAIVAAIDVTNDATIVTAFKGTNNATVYPANC